MNLQELKELIFDNSGLLMGCIIALLSLVEVSKIKINPWTWLFDQIAKKLNGEVMKRFDQLNAEIKKLNSDLKKSNEEHRKDIKKLESDIEDLREESKEREATNNRTRILEFGDELLHGVDYSKEHFDSVLMTISEYENYCSIHPYYMNHVAGSTIKYIKHIYQKRLEQDSFL